MGLFEKDILKGGEKELLKLKSEVEALETCEADLKHLEAKEKEEGKLRDKKKAEIEKEIAEKEKAERKAVEEPFDAKLLELTEQKKAKEKEKEDKRKEVIKERTEAQTGGLKEKKNHLWKQIKEIAEADSLPVIGISKLFLTVYYPKTMAEVLGLLFGCAVIVFGGSFAIFKLFFAQSDISYYVILCESIAIILLLIYIILNNAVKEKHLEAYEDINMLRKEGNQTNNEIKKINKQVAKASEEDLGLTEYQEEIAKLEEEVKACKQERDEALKVFDKDKEGKEAREKLIWDSHEEEMKVLHQNVEEATGRKEERQKELEEREKKLHADYEALRNVEKNIFKLKVIDELLGYIQREEAKTIEEALKIKNGKEE